MLGTLVNVAVTFFTLSLLTVGGGNTVIAEMERQVVNVYHWTDGEQFADIFAIAQAVPGPSMMIVTLLGLAAAGLPGAVVATLCTFGPSALMSYTMARVWERARHAAWRKAVEDGLAPVTVGLVFAGAWTLMESAVSEVREYVLVVASAAILTLWKVNPLLLMAGVAGLSLAYGLVFGVNGASPH